MASKEILDYFKDINYAYNDSTMYDTLKRMMSDMVSVVRCKECIHNSLNRRSGNAYCEFGIGLFQLNDFCSLGERRENEAD